MQFYVIRHTSVLVEKNICYGQSDVPLADSFPAEAKVVAACMSNIIIDRVYSSPLSRCSMLAKYVYPTKIYYDYRLMEMSFGDWEMSSWDCIEKDEFERWEKNLLDFASPGGETFRTVCDRVGDFIKDVSSEQFNIVAIFCHGGIIKAFEAITGRIPMNDPFHKPTAPFGAIVKFEI